MLGLKGSSDLAYGTHASCHYSIKAHTANINNTKVRHFCYFLTFRSNYDAA